MKKMALFIALIILGVAISGEADVTDNKDFRAGLKHYNSRNYQAAVKHFKAYSAVRPDPAALYLIGYSLYQLGKYSEADDYFREAFFIDPEFSLEKAGLITHIPQETITREAASPAAPVAPVAAPDTKSFAPSQPTLQDRSGVTIKPAIPDEKARKAPEPGMPPPSLQEQPAPGQQPAPLSQPPQPAPYVPAARPDMPHAMPAAGVVALLSGMFLFLIILGIALYLFFAFCLYKIAQKLHVTDPWLAFIPLVSLWTLVACAGKPGWWVLLFLVPIVNAFIGIYLWMCISENLGKNKWLGLLVLVPIVGVIYPAWLAFSKTAVSGDFGPGVTLTE